ncbi:mucin-1-like [Thrips palmi]|uniref:Mucin-1-like n=1 Tax=Thrips palmi TaxID=161013 RepID=A0A6P8ZL39_THRPL|nr:mucin-1-like [Thrips palmi]
MADTTCRMKMTWALLCLLVSCALAATAEDSSPAPPAEASTNAISPLAFETVTTQAPVKGPKATQDQDDDDEEDDVGDDGDDDDDDDEDDDEEAPAEAKGSLKSNATVDAKPEAAVKALKDDANEKDSNATVRRHVEHEASTSKSVKITVSKVTGSGNETREALEAEVVVPAPVLEGVPEGSTTRADSAATTDKNKLAEDTLHAPGVEVMQGPRVRRRPSSASTKDKDARRVVRQGDGSLRSREALAARNARSRKAAGRAARQEVPVDVPLDAEQSGPPVFELPPEPKPTKKKKSSQRRRKSRKGTRKPTATPAESLTDTPSPAEAWSRDAAASLAEPTRAIPAKAKRRPALASVPALPEVRVTRQEDEAEASMEALQTATDEVRVSRQGRGRHSVNVQVPSVDFQQVDVNPDGSYRFAYNTNDEGEHFRIEQANSDNLVAGRYGYRDADGRPVQTVYTAGPRGFRARGTDIARKMDLSQSGGRAPRPPPDGRYSPEYDNYFDPLEDPSYSFAFRTPTYARKEDADGRGDVTGVYSYIDDVGERHVVQYEAGAEKGFNVLTAFPDNVPAPGYHLGPGNPPRGRTSIMQNRDGSYRFVAAGPDSRREEVSDQVNNRRGSYSYIDDKGVQQTVEYIAGPGIGYRIVNNHKGVVIPPNYATSYPPFSSSPFPVSPTSPSFPSSPFPSPFPTPFPSPFPTTFPSSSYAPPFSSVSPSVFPVTGRPIGGGSGGSGNGSGGGSRPCKPAVCGYGGSSTTGRPNNQYIPPRPLPTGLPYVPPLSFGDVDDPLSELFPGETGTPLRPGSGSGTNYGGGSSGGRPGSVRPVKKPKPSVSIDPADPDDEVFSGRPSSGSYPTTTSGSSGDDDNAIDGLFGGNGGDGGDVSSTPRPTQRPRPTAGSTTGTTAGSTTGSTAGTYRPPSTSPNSGDDFLDPFATTGPSASPSPTAPSSTPRPNKRPRPRPRPRPTTPRPTPSEDDFDSLFNPTPIYANPSEGPVSSTSSGYDYNRPKKPFVRPGGSGASGVIYPTTIRPGRLPSKPGVAVDVFGPDDDFLDPDGGVSGVSGPWPGRPHWGPVPYGNCCPTRQRPHRFRDERDGGLYPGHQALNAQPFPAGAVVRAHVQSVDLMPFEPEHRAMDPGEALERFIRQEQSIHAHRQRSVDPADGPRGRQGVPAQPPRIAEAVTEATTTTAEPEGSGEDRDAQTESAESEEASAEAVASTPASNTTTTTSAPAAA